MILFDRDDLIDGLRELVEELHAEGDSIYFYDDDGHLFELHAGSLRERLAVYAPPAAG